MQASVGPARSRRLLRRRRVDLPLLGGLRPPVAVPLLLLVCVSLLASFTVGKSDDRAVSCAIVDSQGDIAVDCARSPGASLVAMGNIHGQGEHLPKRLARLTAADGLTLSAQRTRSTDSGYGHHEGNDL